MTEETPKLINDDGSVSLDIFADPVCPWCLIGHAEMEAALTARESHPFEMKWHPFRLNPKFPREGMDRNDYLEQKFGPGGADEMMANFHERAERLGLKIEHNGWQPDTTDAHRLLLWAGLEGRQAEVFTALLSAHWLEGRDIGAKATLVEIADAVGMDAEVIGRLLDSEADRDQIDQLEGQTRERGINAVPTFVVASQHAVGGAQPAQLWNDILDEITEQAKKLSPQA